MQPRAWSPAPKLASMLPLNSSPSIAFHIPSSHQLQFIPPHIPLPAFYGLQILLLVLKVYIIYVLPSHASLRFFTYDQLSRESAQKDLGTAASASQHQQHATSLRKTYIIAHCLS